MNQRSGGWGFPVGLRQAVDHSLCANLTVPEHGTIECDGATCALKCDLGAIANGRRRTKVGFECSRAKQRVKIKTNKSADLTKIKATFGKKNWALVTLARTLLLLNFSTRAASSIKKAEKDASFGACGIKRWSWMAKDWGKICSRRRADARDQTNENVAGKDRTKSATWPASNNHQQPGDQQPSPVLLSHLLEWITNCTRK